MAARGICAPSLVPCAGSRRRAPLEAAELDDEEKAERFKALGIRPTPSKSGILNKRGEALFKGWAERLVVLDDMALRYYDVSYKDTDNLPSSSARGLIPLKSDSKVLKLDGDLAPRSRGAGLDWKGSVTDGKGMPFCFKIETGGQEYVLQAASENERSGWIQVLHARIESLARLNPRAQHQNDLTEEKTSFTSAIMGALSPLSGRSSGRSSPGEDDEITDSLITDGLSHQIKLALKGQEREEKRKRQVEITKKAKQEAKDRGEVYEPEGSKDKSKSVKGNKTGDKHSQPPKGIFSVHLPNVSGGWCSAPDLAPAWLRLCDGQAGGHDRETRGVMSPVLSPRSLQGDKMLEGQVNVDGNVPTARRVYQPSIKSKLKSKAGRAGGTSEADEQVQIPVTPDEQVQVPVTPVTPGGSYVAVPEFTKKAKSLSNTAAGGQCSVSGARALDASDTAGGLDGAGMAAGGRPRGQGDSGDEVVMEALYEFVPEQPDEMPLALGDRVVVVKEFEDGWCSVRLLAPARRKRGKESNSRVKLDAEGIVPRSYLAHVATQHAAANAPDGAAGAMDGNAMTGDTRASEERRKGQGLRSALKGGRKEQLRLEEAVGGEYAQQHFTPLPAQGAGAGADAGPGGGGSGGSGRSGRKKAECGSHCLDEHGSDDPDLDSDRVKHREHGPVLSLLRKKSMSWKSAAAPAEDADQAPACDAGACRGVGAGGCAGVGSGVSSAARYETDEDMSPSTEDEEEKAAIAARKAKQQGTPSAASDKPPLAGRSRTRQASPSGAAGGDAGDGDKEKKKSLLSRNPRKMLSKIAARVRSRSASREPSPRT